MTGFDDTNQENEELARCDCCTKLFKHCHCEEPERDDDCPEGYDGH